MSIPDSARLTDKKAREWWDFFVSFPGFARHWAPQGQGTLQILPQARQIINSADPPPMIKGQQTALLMPVMSGDWLVSRIQYQQTLTIGGALWACTSAFAVIDFQTRRIRAISYQDIDRVSSQEDHVRIELGVSPSAIDLWLRSGRPSKSGRAVKNAFDFISIFGNEGAADAEANSRRMRSETDEYYAKVDLSDRFVRAVANLFGLFARHKPGPEPNTNDIKQLRPWPDKLSGNAGHLMPKLH